MKSIVKYSILTLSLTACVAAPAQVISWNLDDYGTVGDPGGGFSANQAGVVLAANWNNTWWYNRTVDLTDNTGAATTLDISYASNSGTWGVTVGNHPGVDADGTYNKELLNGYLNGTGANSVSIALSQIPYSVYDIYVYFASDNSTRVGTVTDGATTYSFGVLDNMIAGPNALFVQTTDTGLSYPEANYAVFSGLSGATQTISTSFLNAGEYGGIAGFQVVAVPEPGTTALIAVGSLALLGLRRRK